MRRPFRSLVVGICCWIMVSCGDSGNGLEPTDVPTPESYSDLFGSVLVDAFGNQVGVATIESTPVVGILFAAGWCPHCAAFVLQLESFYAELEQAGKPFEVVFVSFDETAGDMTAHMIEAAMPWLGVPFGSTQASTLKLLYNVQSIPTMIVVDSDANTISTSGRSDVVLKGAQAYDDWLAVSGG